MSCFTCLAGRDAVRCLGCGKGYCSVVCQKRDFRAHRNACAAHPSCHRCGAVAADTCRACHRQLCAAHSCRELHAERRCRRCARAFCAATHPRLAFDAVYCCEAPAPPAPLAPRPLPAASVRVGEDKNTCVVCEDAAPTHVCVPCGHQCACGECSGRLRSCPICRAPLEKCIKVYSV